jgi:hypothetical protein
VFPFTFIIHTVTTNDSKLAHCTEQYWEGVFQGSTIWQDDLHQPQYLTQERLPEVPFILEENVDSVRLGEKFSPPYTNFITHTQNKGYNATLHME